jgi:hypothetical protein
MDQKQKVTVGIRQFEKKKPKGCGYYLFETGSIIATASVALGVIILGWQAVSWQQSGTWTGVSLLDLLKWAGLSLTRYGEAANLQGSAALFQLLLSLPSFVTVPVIGVAFFVLTSLFSRSGR